MTIKKKFEGRMTVNQLSHRITPDMKVVIIRIYNGYAAILTRYNVNFPERGMISIVSDKKVNIMEADRNMRMGKPFSRVKNDIRNTKYSVCENFSEINRPMAVYEIL